VVRFLAWLDEFYDFFARDIGGQALTWRHVRDLLCTEPATKPAPLALAAA
jgi:hypothetical protein